MVEVGIRELKSRLSYYVRLAQAGEMIAIKVRDRIVSFLSNAKPAEMPRGGKRRSKRDIAQIIERLKKEGIVLSGGPYRHRPFNRITMTPGPSSAEMIRQMRDEEW
ncbi:MAG: hypothetical protein HY543_03525 [Deltaproteobacteria bacterium]|nr:hypothetical protein [Deltaproteobacteria bacterium]